MRIQMEDKLYRSQRITRDPWETPRPGGMYRRLLIDGEVYHELPVDTPEEVAAWEEGAPKVLALHMGRELTPEEIAWILAGREFVQTGEDSIRATTVEGRDKRGPDHPPPIRHRWIEEEEDEDEE